MKMAWKLENMRKDPNSKEAYADLFTSQIKEEPKTACLFTIGDARAVEIILEKYKNTQFVVFDYPALIKFLDFAKPANLFKTIPIKYDWESEKDFLKFVEEEMRKVSIEEVNMSFDLIIANPPYGIHNNVAKKIMRTVLKTVKDSIWLVPKNTYKDKELWKRVKDIRLVENCFADANVQNLSIANLDCTFCNTESFENLKLSKRQIQVKDAILNYNTSHKTTSFYIPYAGGKESKIIKDVLNIESKETLKEAFLSGKLFFMTQWTPSNGVHSSDESEDIQANLKNNMDWNKKGLPMHAFYFEKAVQKTNFSKWWYSCNSNQRDKKLRIGLTNFILSILRDARSANGGGFDEFFPNLDWSRPWIDQEILKEIGLPEDFLEKEEC